MKFSKFIALSIGLISVSGMNAGWLETLTGAQQTQSQQPAANADWMSQLGGLFGQSQKPAAAPTQLGIPSYAGQNPQVAGISEIQQNIAAIVSKVREMAPAITTAITNKDFTSAAALAAPARDLLTLAMSTAKSIQSVLASNPQLKGVVSGLVAQLTPMINPVAAQIRALAQTSGWGTSFTLKTIAAGLEQVPQLLNQAAK